MKSNILFILFFLSLSAFAQEQSVEEINTLDNQFKTTYRRSTSYQEYKVVKKDSYNELHKNALDSIKAHKLDIEAKEKTINTQNATITKLQSDNTELTTKLNTSEEKENSISLFGMQLSKSSYALVLFSIIGILFIFLIYFIYKFKNSNVLTVDAKYNLEEVEGEFNMFRKKSLEREQKLRRQLQDEIIKNRNT